MKYPNRLVPSGATRDLRAMLEGAERGQRVMASPQRNYDCFEPF